MKALVQWLRIHRMVSAGVVAALLVCTGLSAQEEGSADTARSAKRLITVCRACHSLDQDASQSNAPTLYGVFGRKAGSNQGFEYSDAMKHSSLIWSEQTLDLFLKNPQAAIPGNKMAYIGMPAEEDRKILIAYLKKQTSAP